MTAPTPESLTALAVKLDNCVADGPLFRDAATTLRAAAAALEAWDKMHHEVRDRLLASIDAERSLREQAQKSAVEIELECREAWKQAAHWRSLAEQAERTVAELRELLREISETWALHGIAPELEKRIAAALQPRR